jgi:hypothetical protein
MEYEDIRSDGTGFFQDGQLPLMIGRDHLVDTFEGIPPDHGFIHSPFSFRRRTFDLRIQFGVRSPSGRLLDQVNDVLATFEPRSEAARS